MINEIALRYRSSYPAVNGRNLTDIYTDDGLLIHLKQANIANLKYTHTKACTLGVQHNWLL